MAIHDTVDAQTCEECGYLTCPVWHCCGFSFEADKHCCNNTSRVCCLSPGAGKLLTDTLDIFE